MKKNTGKMTRRGLLKAGAGLALGGVLTEMAPAAPAAIRPSVYEALGVKHVINATGTVTNLGGSLMPPEVAAAWVEASRHFVNLLDLQAKVGRPHRRADWGGSRPGDHRRRRCAAARHGSRGDPWQPQFHPALARHQGHAQ